jgi:glutamate-ammonia-ligase adenylyltransferase
MGALRLDEEPGGGAARASCRTARPRAAQRGAALRVPPLSRLQRVRRAAHAAPADPRARGARSAGRPERANDVKLSRGGIREIEFIVQLLQVVRGGQFPELRTRPTLDALQRLAAPASCRGNGAALARPTSSCAASSTASSTWTTSRRTCCPWAARRRRAGENWPGSRTMGYADCCPFLHELDTHRELVAQEFDKLLGGGHRGEPCKAAAPARGRAAPPDLDDLLEHLPAQLRSASSAGAPPARAGAARRRARTACRAWCSAPPVAAGRPGRHEEAALRMADWIEPLLRRESYLALLLERPGRARAPAAPAGRGALAGALPAAAPGRDRRTGQRRLLKERFVPAEDSSASWKTAGASLQITGEDDDETLLNLLRRAHHAELFRTLARDVEGR